jgi:hypothetical protein
VALATNADLESAVASWMNRVDLGTRIPDFVLLAEADINRLLRTPWNYTTNTAFSQTARKTNLPTDFLEMDRVIYTNGSVRNELRFMPNDAMAVYDSGDSDEPIWYTIVGTQIEVAPYRTGTMTLELNYWSTIGPIASSVPTIFTKHPNVYLYGAMWHAALYMVDSDRAMLAKEQFDRALQAVQRAGRRARYGDAMRIVPA